MIDFNELGEALKPQSGADLSRLADASHYKDLRIKALEERVADLEQILDKVASEYNYFLNTYNSLLDDTK